MSVKQKLMSELKAVAVTTAYFGLWIGVLIVLKELVLAEYEIYFRDLSMALMGALILAKVVLILEHVPLGSWTRTTPAIVEVLVRTGMYGLGVLVVLLLEKAFEARHEYGGFGSAIAGIFDHRDMPHVWANTICVTAALFNFNALTVIRHHLGEHGLARLFLSPSPATPKPDSSP